MKNNVEEELVIGIDCPITKKKGSSKKVVKKATSKKSIKRTNSNKKKVKKKNLIRFFGLIIIFGIILFLFNSNWFKITKIDVKNNERVLLEEIEEIINGEGYKNIFWVFSNRLEAKLKSENAYIENVEITKKLPNTLIIDITERVPKYMLQFADSYVYINNQGYMLEVSTENLGIPIILGFITDLSNIEVGKRLDIEDLKKLEMVIKIVEIANINEVGEYITKIDISDEKNYILILETEEKTVYLGDCSDLNTRMLYLNGILELTKDTPGEIFIDMDLNTEEAFFREKT